MPPSGASNGHGYIKISVEEPGIYQVTTQDLNKLGYPGILESPERLQLTLRGQAVSFWVDGAGAEQALYFYGFPADSLYTLENIYWLAINLSVSPSESLAILEDDLEVNTAGPSSFNLARLPGSSYWAWQLLETNQVYMPQVEGSEHWLWQIMPAPTTIDIPIDIDSLIMEDLSGIEAHLRLVLWSQTQAVDIDPDHHIQANVNGQPIGDETFDGLGEHIIDLAFPAAYLQDGENLVTLNLPGDTGVLADVNYLNWVGLYYPRQLVAQNDRLLFRSQGGEQYATGFSENPSIFDITQPQAAFRLEAVGATATDSRGEIVFNAEAGHTYYLAGANGYLSPAQLANATMEPDLKNGDLAVDYVAIAPQDLLTPLEPLLSWREKVGLRTLGVPLQAVYDQFNDGYPEPEAIGNFMLYAASSWENPPRYLLLVGDASYDPRGYITSPEMNRLPTFLVDTVYGGQTASDVGFVQFNEDPWPDLPVGRIPAQNSEQVKIVVDKVLAYEQDLPAAGWQAGILAVADGQEPSFQTDAQSFLDRFPAGYRESLYSPPAGSQDAHQEISRLIAGDNLLVVYFGHGSVNMWGKDRLFSTADAEQLAKPERLPVVLNMTCLTGLFTHPKTESLSETMLWHPGGGAVALLAPSSLTLPYDQSFLTNAFVDGLVNDQEATLGDLHLLARRQVPAETASSQDVMQTFMLFGDPALRLPRPSAALSP